MHDQALAISAVHVHGAQSKAVQDIVAQLLRVKIGFGEEVVIAPVVGFVTRARPDFFFGLAKGGASLPRLNEAGRPPTTTTKDLWKAHISPNAQHLFLIVPMANWNEAGAARERPFLRVRSRLSAFFGDSGREIDVISLHVFGYGGDTLIQEMK